MCVLVIDVSSIQSYIVITCEGLVFSSLLAVTHFASRSFAKRNRTMLGYVCLLAESMAASLEFGKHFFYLSYCTRLGFLSQTTLWMVWFGDFDSR